MGKNLADVTIAHRLCMPCPPRLPDSVHFARFSRGCGGLTTAPGARCRRGNDADGPAWLRLKKPPSPTFSTRGKRRAKSIGVHRKSPLQNWDLGASGALRGRDARRWLRRQIELELLEKQLLVGIELSIATEDQHASVGCREVHVEHLHGGHLVEHRP